MTLVRIIHFYRKTNLRNTYYSLYVNTGNDEDMDDDNHSIATSNIDPMVFATNTTHHGLNIENNSEILSIPTTDNRYSFILPNNYRVMLDLVELCAKHSLPNDFLDKILSIIKKGVQTHNVTVASLPTYTMFVSYLKKNFQTPSPTTIHHTIEFPHTEKNLLHRKQKRMGVDIVTFDFKQQLQDLLFDRNLFTDVSKLVVNEDPAHRWLPFDRHKNKFHRDEILAGNWYNETINQCLSIKDGTEMIIPIIFYVDKTGTDILQRHSLEPFMFTLGIFDRSIRNQPTAWRTLGLIPNLDSMSTVTKAEGSKNCDFQYFY